MGILLFTTQGLIDLFKSKPGGVEQDDDGCHLVPDSPHCRREYSGSGCQDEEGIEDEGYADVSHDIQSGSFPKGDICRERREISLHEDDL